MPVEQFNYRRPANGSAEGVVPLSQAWGTRVHGTDRVGSAAPSVVPAGLYSTAPYVDDRGVHTNPIIVSGPEVRHDPVRYACTAMRTDGTPCTAPVNTEGGMCGPHVRKLKEQTDRRTEPA